MLLDNAGSGSNELLSLLGKFKDPQTHPSASSTITIIYVGLGLNEFTHMALLKRLKHHYE